MIPVIQPPPKDTLYLYLDEGGDLGFSKLGSKYFVLTAVTCLGVPKWAEELDVLRAQLCSAGLNIPYFHASEDKQNVRDQVFKIICSHQNKFWIDCLVVEKAKTGTSLQEPVQFYSRMMYYLLKWRFRNISPAKVDKMVVVTDRLPATKKQKKAVEKAIKEELAKPSPSNITAIWGNNLLPYEIRHEASKHHPCLQVVDYCNWAIFRKWTSGDARSYDLIKSSIKSEFDIFRTGTRFYY